MNYQKMEIHSRLIRNIALNVELHINDYRNWNISEYKVQHFITSFLTNSLNNTEYQAREEKHGKFDCVIQKKEKNHSKQKPKPIVLYELKTYIKPHEKLNKEAYSAIVCDFTKLKRKMEEEKDIDNKIKGYFILVFTSKNLIKPYKNFTFLYEYSNESKKWHSFEEEDKDKNMVQYKIRPSGKVKIGKTLVFTWEIK